MAARSRFRHERPGVSCMATIARLILGSDNPANTPGVAVPFSNCVRKIRITNTSANRLSAVPDPHRLASASARKTRNNSMVSSSVTETRRSPGNTAIKGFASPPKSTWASTRRSSGVSENLPSCAANSIRCGCLLPAFARKRMLPAPTAQTETLRAKREIKAERRS